MEPEGKRSSAPGCSPKIENRSAWLGCLACSDSVKRQASASHSRSTTALSFSNRLSKRDIENSGCPTSNNAEPDTQTDTKIKNLKDFLMLFFSELFLLMHRMLARSFFNSFRYRQIKRGFAAAHSSRGMEKSGAAQRAALEWSSNDFCCSRKRISAVRSPRNG